MLTTAYIKSLRATLDLTVAERSQERGVCFSASLPWILGLLDKLRKVRKGKHIQKLSQDYSYHVKHKVVTETD